MSRPIRGSNANRIHFVARRVPEIRRIELLTESTEIVAEPAVNNC